MRSFFAAIFGGLLSWWGIVLIAAFDSSMVFFLPFGVDIAVIILVSRNPHLFWFYPVIAAAGSLAGAAITLYVGRRLGDAGLDHFVPKNRLAAIRHRVEEKGAVALAVLDLIPPPFPFTAFILAAGALKVDIYLFFTTLFLSRVVRFGGEAVLAYFYGPRIIAWLESDIVEYIGVGLLFVAIVGTIITAIQLVRKTRAHRGGQREPRAA